MITNAYDADYFLRGKQTGKSLYEDYRWIPGLTIPMAQIIANHCGIKKGDHILDFGCARGYVVKALRLLGYEAYGTDISKWAVENADEEIKPYISCSADKLPIDSATWNGHSTVMGFDWIIAKDVLEHIPYVSYTITNLMNAAAKGVFAVVPLSLFDSSAYVIEEYETDVTHIQRLTLNTWLERFIRPGWSVEASYRMIGVKDNYAQYERGNGFITARRL